MKNGKKLKLKEKIKKKILCEKESLKETIQYFI